MTRKDYFLFYKIEAAILEKYLCKSPKETNVKEISKNNAMYFSQRKGGLRIISLFATHYYRENLLIRINESYLRGLPDFIVVKVIILFILLTKH